MTDPTDSEVQFYLNVCTLRDLFDQWIGLQQAIKQKRPFYILLVDAAFSIVSDYALDAEELKNCSTGSASVEFDGHIMKITKL